VNSKKNMVICKNRRSVRMSDNGAYMASGLLSLQTSENDNEIYAGIDEHTPPTPHPSSALVEHATLQLVDASEFIPSVGRIGLNRQRSVISHLRHYK
jgi:hypothetical protein